MAFYWFLLLCMAPIASVKASDAVQCVMQSPLETPYFTPWLTLPRQATGCSSPVRQGAEDAADLEVHVLRLVGYGGSTSVNTQASSNAQHVPGPAAGIGSSRNEATSGRNKQWSYPASNSHLPQVNVTMNGFSWDWGDIDNGTSATVPPPASFSHMVLVLFTDHPVRWGLHSIALPEISEIIVVVNDHSFVESNFPVKTMKANWSSKVDLAQHVLNNYGAITSYTEVDGANQVDLKVGYASTHFQECDTNSSKKSSVVSASFAVKQKTEGCFHENNIGYNSWDVYVVELSPIARRRNEEEGELDSDDSSLVASPVAVLLEGEGPLPVPRNVTLVLKSRAPIRWRFGSSGVEGSIVVVSNQEVENLGMSTTTVGGSAGSGHLGFGLKKSAGLEVRSQTLPDTMDALLVQVASQFGPPVLYAKTTSSASTLKLLVGNGRNSKSPTTGSPNLDDGHSNHPVPFPSHSSGKSLSWLGIEPSNDKGRKNSNVKGSKSSPLSLLQNSMVVDCERKKIIVSFPRDLADSLGVIWMAFTDSSCTSQQNSSHYWLSTLITSCGSTSSSDGKSSSFKNNVFVRFGPTVSDDEDFAGPIDDGGGGELGSGAYSSESDLFESSPNRIPVVCRHPPIFPGVGFGPLHFDDASSLDPVEVSGGSKSPSHNKLYHMEVYRDREHTIPIDFNKETPAEVAFDETLHVKTWIDGVFPIQVVTENCWVSNSSDPNWNSRVLLIRNTCPLDLSVNIEEPSKISKSRSPPHGGFSFQVNNEYGHLGNLYVHCRLGVCTSDVSQAKGNLVLCVQPHEYCSGQILHALLDKPVSTAQQLTTRGPLRPVPKRRPGKMVGGTTDGLTDKGKLAVPTGTPVFDSDGTGLDDVSAIAGEALAPNQRIPQQVLVVGISTEVAVGIALASFAIGVGLTTSLWCIHLHTDPFRNRRRNNKHLVQVMGVPSGNNSILCEGGGSTGPIVGVAAGCTAEGYNLSPHSGCSTTNSQDDMNLSEEKKEPLRTHPMMTKKEMLRYHGRAKLLESRSRFERPADYINYLSNTEQSVDKLYNCVSSLRISLTNNPISWMKEFGTDGLKKILNLLNNCYSNYFRNHDRLQHECIRCLRAIMNNTVGLKMVFQQQDALMVIARSLDASKQSVMYEAAKLLAAVCLVQPNGHEIALAAIATSGELRRKERFTPIIDGLLIKSNDALRVVCMQLINAIVTTPDDMDFRIHLRNEFMRMGLSDALELLSKDASEDLAKQVKIFQENREEDYEEFMQRFDNVRLELDDPVDCFDVLKNLVTDTPSEPYFLSILQHLLFIRDDTLIRPAYYKLIEECISQIVLHRGGCDPDFKKKNFNLDVEPLIESLVERSKADEERQLNEIKLKLEEALAAKQESEAKLAHAYTKISELEDLVTKGGGQLPKAGLLNIPQHPPTLVDGPPPPPPPPMPGMGPPPPPPPMPGMGPPPPPPFPGGPPPPPPMPGMGPPPPPMPGMGPPPPPMPGMGPPPPPMGPPMMGAMKPPDVLPHGLKPKRKWDVEVPLKRTNWKTIIPQNMSEKSFWVRVQEEKLASNDFLSSLAERFSSKPPKTFDGTDSKSGDPSASSTSGKKVKDLKVLDGKSAQNLSILLGGSLKHMSYRNVRRCILRCDDSLLSGSVLDQLIAYLPPPDQLKKLEEYKDRYDELTEAEQFAVTIAEVKRLLPRLKSMSFKQHYAEMVQDIKPDIVAGTAACEEIKQSKKFAKVLELILLIGNYMNTGSRNAQAFGFEISYLPKLSSTKDVENKMTLLHFLVETIEKKFPELLNFGEELAHVDRAARVSTDSLQKALRLMDSSIRNLEMDLANSKVPQGEDDLFAQVMGDFCKEAREQYTILVSMFRKLESLYTDISEYYSFDKQKYTLEEFFGDIKTFKDNFAQAQKDVLKAREAEEKLRRTRELQEKAVQERQERAARKKALVDMNAADMQEGVMDSLLEALQTGSAFTRDQKRKRPPRVAGAERRAQLNRSRSRTGLIGREFNGELLSTA